MIDKIKRIKISRMKPEELYLMELFHSMTIKVQTVYPKSLFFHKGDIFLFELNMEDRTITFNIIIWSDLQNDYGYGKSYFYVNELIRQSLYNQSPFFNGQKIQLKRFANSRWNIIK